ncbi:hypothetical protein ACIQU6_07495 [Streptomyces sp. NPDC090442]|uniref:hypothetical protein n=1 Tax=Streptomyces sp. NPDC090442 TaxID=3365962 RepID=UPI00380EEAC2
MGKVNTIKRGGSRFYVSPEDPGIKYPGVTSVCGMLPKGFLTFWAAKLVAEEAVENLPHVLGIAMRDRDAAIDYLKRTPTRTTAKAADLGSDAHDLFERMARGEDVRRVHPDLEPHRTNFAEFLDRFQPEFLSLEHVAWSDSHQYAGSYDAIMRVTVDGTPEVVMADWKTTRSGIHADVALQLSAYRYADKYLDGADGSEITTVRPEEITAAAVFHSRPEAWQFTPVRAEYDVFDMFKRLRKVFEWDRVMSKGVIGTPLHVSSEMTGTARRAAR